MGHIYHCGCVDDQYISPYQTRARWLLWLLSKSRPFISKYRPLGPTYFNIWSIFTIVDVWMINTYHHTKPESRWLLWLLRKSRPFILLYRPLGPTYFNIWGIFTIVGLWMIDTYHHTKPETINCL